MTVGSAVISALLALIAIAVTYLGFRLSGKAIHAQATAAAKAVDAEAYERARKIYTGAIDQLQTEIADVRRSKNELALQVDKLQTEVSKLTAYRNQVDSLQAERERMIAEIMRYGGTWPPTVTS